MSACGCSLQQPDPGEDPAEFSVPCVREKPGTVCAVILKKKNPSHIRMSVNT